MSTLTLSTLKKNLMKKNGKKGKKSPLEHETEYVEFLRKRLQSENFRANATTEEIEETKRKYDRAKLKLKFLQQDSKR